MSKKRRVKLGIPSAEMHGGLHQCHIGEKAHARLRAAFLDVIHFLCEREEGFTHDHATQLFPVSHSLREIGTFEPDVPPKLRELWEAIDEAVSDAQARGEESGASLLKQLASGKATIDDYNEATIAR
jgi:hypothetical protein